MLLNILLPESAEERSRAHPIADRLFPLGTKRWEALRSFQRMRERNLPLLVIIGCGRSGTQYVASLFDQLGVVSGHESFVPGVRQRILSSWLLTGNATRVPWGPSLSDIAHRKVNYVHQMRHPLSVISSALTFHPDSWEYVARHIDCDAERPLRRAMQYWLYWNRLAEGRARFSYQLEQIDASLPRLVAEAELNIPRDTVMRALQSTSRTVNARSHGALQWVDLDAEDATLAREIRALARRYGYPAES